MSQCEAKFRVLETISLFKEKIERTAVQYAQKNVVSDPNRNK